MHMVAFVRRENCWPWPCYHFRLREKSLLTYLVSSTFFNQISDQYLTQRTHTHTHTRECQWKAAMFQGFLFASFSFLSSSSSFYVLIVLFVCLFYLFIFQSFRFQFLSRYCGTNSEKKGGKHSDDLRRVKLAVINTATQLTQNWQTLNGRRHKCSSYQIIVTNRPACMAEGKEVSAPGWHMTVVVIFYVIVLSYCHYLSFRFSFCPLCAEPHFSLRNAIQPQDCTVLVCLFVFIFGLYVFALQFRLNFAELWDSFLSLFSSFFFLLLLFFCRILPNPAIKMVHGVTETQVSYWFRAGWIMYEMRVR